MVSALGGYFIATTWEDFSDKKGWRLARLAEKKGWSSSNHLFGDDYWRSFDSLIYGLIFIGTLGLIMHFIAFVLVRFLNVNLSEWLS